MTQPTTQDVPAPPDSGNRVVVSPAWQSPATWLSVLVTVAGVLLAVPDLLPPAARPYVVGFVAIMAGLGIHAVKGVAVDAGNQASNRAPGDGGPKAKGDPTCS